MEDTSGFKSLREKMKRRKKEREELMGGITVSTTSSLTSLASGTSTTPSFRSKSSESVFETIHPSPAKRKLTRENSFETTFLEMPSITVEDVDGPIESSKYSHEGDAGGHQTRNESMDDNDLNLESLLSLPSTREKQNKKVGEEIFELLSKPTVKEKSLMERFKSADGGTVQEFCIHGTRDDCNKDSLNQSTNAPAKSSTPSTSSSSSSVHSTKCDKLHFKKIIQKHTDESLGDCSFLNTCFHMDSCKYVHYEVDYTSSSGGKNGTSQLKSPRHHLKSLSSEKSSSSFSSSTSSSVELAPSKSVTVLYPPQYIQSDLRFFDVSILGKFAVVMADPPWDIHMELPYGTMSDDEMRALNIPCLQDDGLIFLWVTGRAMELGRECLSLWGYQRCDELIWVKTNQLQRIIRTGRTGHWLNHGKEHCLVGIKGSGPKNLNRGLDCDVIVAEVRATSHKPDEIYGIIERLSPGTRKIELFGRHHNVQPNWITLGNQLDGVKLIDPVLIENFKRRYPDGDCLKKS